MSANICELLILVFHCIVFWKSRGPWPPIITAESLFPISSDIRGLHCLKAYDGPIAQTSGFFRKWCCGNNPYKNVHHLEMPVGKGYLVFDIWFTIQPVAFSCTFCTYTLLDMFSLLVTCIHCTNIFL